MPRLVKPLNTPPLMFEPVLISPIVLGLLILLVVVLALVARNQTVSARTWKSVVHINAKRAYQRGQADESAQHRRPLDEKIHDAFQRGLAEAHSVWTAEFDSRLQKELSDRACACQTSQDQFEAFEKGAAGA